MSLLAPSHISREGHHWRFIALIILPQGIRAPTVPCSAVQMLAPPLRRSTVAAKITAWEACQVLAVGRGW